LFKRRHVSLEYINEKLMEFNKYLSGRKVAVIGLGVSNLPLLDYLYKLKSQVTVFDKTDIKDLDEELVRKITDMRNGNVIWRKLFRRIGRF
jgi:thioredoxin reductase